MAIRQDLSQRRQQPPDRASRGFTLIELLVVIAIIALLMSILIPALSKAKDAARRTICQTNMRQLGIATQSYLGENRDYYPQAGKDTGLSPSATVQQQNCWYWALDPYLNLQDTSGTRRNVVFYKQDPVWKTFDSSIQDTNQTIKMNENFSDFSSGPSVVWTKQTDANLLAWGLSKVLLFVDGRAYDIRPSDTGTAGQFHGSPGTVALRHSKGANITYADGHAVYLRQKIKPKAASGSPVEDCWYDDTDTDSRKNVIWDFPHQTPP